MTDKALSMSDEEIHDVWGKAYAGQEFIVLLEPGTLPATANVVGSNAAHVQVVTDRHSGRLIAFAAIDNLNRGTAKPGRAVAERRTWTSRRQGTYEDWSSTVSVTFAKGFSAAGVAAGISSIEGKKDLALVVNQGRSTAR